MPPKNSPIKAATTTPKHQNTPSPPRKTNTKRESSNFVQKLLNADQVKYKTVGIPGLAIGLILKSDGVGPAYVGKILGFVENNAEKMDRCKLLLVTQLRNPNGMNSLDPDGEMTINQAVTEFAKVITEIAKNDCKDDWKYGTPFFPTRVMLPLRMFNLWVIILWMRIV
jgi:hypothetical protein